MPAPHPRERSLDFFLEAGDPFAVGGDQRLLALDLGDDGFLHVVEIMHLRTGP